MNNNENIDLMIANYLNILSNPNIFGKLDSQTVHNMQSAVAIYSDVTARKYVEAFKRQQAIEAQQEEVNKLFR